MSGSSLFVQWKVGHPLPQGFFPLVLLTIGLGNSLLWVFILCIKGHLAASLGSTHYLPLLPIPPSQSVITDDNCVLEGKGALQSHAILGGTEGIKQKG